jgi:hypothetical protein
MNENQQSTFKSVPIRVYPCGDTDWKRSKSTRVETHGRTRTIDKNTTNTYNGINDDNDNNEKTRASWTSPTINGLRMNVCSAIHVTVVVERRSRLKRQSRNIQPRNPPNIQNSVNINLILSSTFVRSILVSAIVATPVGRRGKHGRNVLNILFCILSVVKLVLGDVNVLLCHRTTIGCRLAMYDSQMEASDSSPGR